MVYTEGRKGERRVRIKEVEARVGLCAKNIRFYEKEGLLAPPAAGRQRLPGL